MTIVQVRRDRVVVGIDASQTSKYAVLWAAEEARIRRCALVITHVDPLSFDGGDVGRKASAQLEELLALCAAAASLRQPSVPVATLLLHGDVTDQLVTLSGTSSLLVIGVDRGRSRAAHGALGPVEDRVIAHAGCPVVVVSSRPRVDEARRRHVLAGCTDTTVGRHLLRAAVDEADLRADSLGVVVLPPPEQDRLADPMHTGSMYTGSIQTGSIQAEHSLGHQIDLLRQARPQLDISVDQPDRDHLDTLLELGRKSDLIIVPADQAEDRWSIRLGPWAADLIRLSPCPVMLLGRLSLSSALAA